MDIEDRKKLFDDGYFNEETGGSLAKDKTGFAATKVFMKGVTKEMLIWWFNWHSLEPLRYKIWYPDAHTNISNDQGQKYFDSNKTKKETRIFNTM